MLMARPASSLAGRRPQYLHVAREHHELNLERARQLQQRGVARLRRGVDARQQVVRNAVAGGERLEVAVGRCDGYDLAGDRATLPAIEQVVQAMALAGHRDQDARPVAGVVQLPAHCVGLGQRGDRPTPTFERALRLVGEVDAHEEDGLVRVAELLAVEDVAAALRNGPRNGVDDAAPVGARQGQDQLSVGHGVPTAA